MALSVSHSKGGSGLSHLLRQPRPIRGRDDQPGAAGDQPAPAPSRGSGAATIDSTGIGTAQISAALVIYLSKLGGADQASADAGAGAPKQQDAPNTSSAEVEGGDVASAQDTAGATPPRSAAADVLRALDAYADYGTGPTRRFG